MYDLNKKENNDYRNYMKRNSEKIEMLTKSQIRYFIDLYNLKISNAEREIDFEKEYGAPVMGGDYSGTSIKNILKQKIVLERIRNQFKGLL